MAADVEAIMTALKERLATVPGLQTFDGFPGKITPDSAWPSLGTEVGRELTFCNEHFLNRINIMVVTGVWGGDLLPAQRRLYRYISPVGEHSIREAILEDETLGGLIHCMPVVGPWEEPGTIRIGDVDYVGATLPLELND